MTLHTVVSKTQRSCGVVGLSCDQDVESLRHENQHFLLRVRIASVQTNGQSRTDHEADIVKR